MEAFIALGNDAYFDSTVFIATCSALSAVGGVLIAVRCVASVKQIGRLYLDDYAMIVGLAFLVATFVMTHLLERSYDEMYKKVMSLLGLESKRALPPSVPDYLFDPILEMDRIWVATITVANLSTWTTKLPLMLMLARLFSVKPWVPWISYGMLVASLLVTIAITAWSGAACDMRGQWDTNVAEICSPRSARGHLASGIVGLIVDVVLFILPLPIIIRLNVPFKRKIGYAIVFTTGILGIVVSIVGCYWRKQALSGKASDRKVSILCVVLEGIIAILLGCVPAYYYIYRNIIIKANKFSNATSGITATKSTRKPTSTARQSHMSRRYTTTADETINSTQGDWIKMDTPPVSRDRSRTREPEPSMSIDTARSSTDRDHIIHIGYDGRSNRAQS
ncbi:unnamed protein product [Clonostachys rhizophaga]|uniref:Rhodopsin domain-containing protein n=1 Tax=Clonostachys rhizophaga TaxID=160324 RepID=A0A9N9W4K7_9HYPO|nr:unnamed protein product [Clonostachys rhizophaga]